MQQRNNYTFHSKTQSLSSIVYDETLKKSRRRKKKNYRDLLFFVEDWIVATCFVDSFSTFLSRRIDVKRKRDKKRLQTLKTYARIAFTVYVFLFTFSYKSSANFNSLAHRFGHNSVTRTKNRPILSQSVRVIKHTKIVN